MVKLNSLLFILYVWMVNGGGRTVTAKLLMTMYYESNCPDTKSFVLQQLLPVMRLLHEHVRMRFVPFGLATSTDYGFGGFRCRHGEMECYGNMVQDCALDLMQRRGYSDMDKLNYIACEMHNSSSLQGNLRCVEQAKLDPKKVEDCLISNKGTRLQLISEYETSLVAPKFIPTVTINKVFDQQTQDDAMKKLLGTLCSYLQNTPACSLYFNRMAWGSIMNRPKITMPYSTHYLQ